MNLNSIKSQIYRADMLKFRFFSPTLLCKMCWSEVKNNNQHTKKEVLEALVAVMWEVCSRAKKTVASMYSSSSLCPLSPNYTKFHCQPSERMEIVKAAQQEMPREVLGLKSASAFATHATYPVYGSHNTTFYTWSRSCDHQILIMRFFVHSLDLPLATEMQRRLRQVPTL